MSDDDSEERDSTEINMLEITREEAHRTVDQQLQTLNDVDTKAIKILRLNLVLLSIILTGLSIVSSGLRSDESVARILYIQLHNIYTFTGLLSIIVSTSLAALTYTTSSMRSGLSGKDISSILYNNNSDKENLYGIVGSYSEWIQQNFRTNTRNAPLGTATIIFLVYGIVLLAVGVYDTVTSGIMWYESALVIFSISIFTIQTKIINQINRYRKNRNG
ncbi:MAG: hypothetical protein ABEI13_02550 [Candidatus Paceibacteria bacterium]